MVDIGKLEPLQSRFYGFLRAAAFASRTAEGNKQSRTTMTNKFRHFLTGMSSAIDIGATSTRSAVRVGAGLDLHRTDAEALSDDWLRLTQDFRSAFDKTTGNGGEHGTSA